MWFHFETVKYSIYYKKNKHTVRLKPIQIECMVKWDIYINIIICTCCKNTMCDTFLLLLLY